MAVPILRITDGVSTIDLLSRSGFMVKDWTPARAEMKGEGVWQDSPLATGRRLAMHRLTNIVDTFDIVNHHRRQDMLIEGCQNADRLLTKALSYWENPFLLEPVWIEARGSDETNTRYALIHSYTFPNDDNPYSQPFWNCYLADSGMDDLTLIIEHGLWQDLPPGYESCIDISAEQDYTWTSGGADVVTTFGRTDEGVCSGVSGAAGHLMQEAIPPVSLDHIVLEDGTGFIALDFNPGTASGVYVGNKHNKANLSHGFYWNGAFSANLTIAMWPFTILPGGAGDYVAFGCQTLDDDSGPFCSLVFDISTPGTGTLVWQYWNGAWTTFAAANVTDGTNQFAMSGVCSVHWEQPADWVTTAVNGITGYWVRALVTGAGGAVIQGNRLVYSIVWPSVLIDDYNGDSPTPVLQLGGDLPALSHLELFNMSGDSDTNLEWDRCSVGLRSTGRGSTFSPYWNCAEEQNPPGVTVSLSNVAVPGAFVVESEGPTGWCGAFTVNAGVEEFVDYNLTSAAYLQYRGIYHAYCRLRQRTGVANLLRAYVDIGVVAAGTYHRLWRSLLSTGTGNTYIGTNPYFEVVDLGRVTIPPTVPSDVFNDINIRLTLANPLGGGAIEVDVWDLILMPVDEWAGMFQEIATGTAVGSNRCLDVDSITDPKYYIKSTNEFSDSGTVFVPVQPVTNGPAILQANAEQRLWFFFSLGDNADPAISASVGVHAVQRYQSMRGAR